MFQSSPGLLAGCNWSGLQPAMRKRFQSSPGLLAGCNTSGSWHTFSTSSGDCFNPHPAFWPGATRLLGDRRLGLAIRWVFQSSPGLLAGCNLRPAPGYLEFQSSPGLLSEIPSIGESTGRFQSSPGLLAGCNLQGRAISAYEFSWFQSSPGLLAGCNQGSSRTGTPWIVRVFQSSPGLLAGCNFLATTSTDNGGPGSLLFQSSPGLLAGCNHGKTGCL